MLDLVITVLIIGILAAVAAPKYADSMRHFQLEAAAQAVAADLRHARQHAKTKGSNQSVVFTQASNSYDLPGMRDINHSSEPYTVDLSKTGYPATLISVSFGASGTGNSILFDLYGRPDFGGSVVVEAAGQQRTILVAGETGRVSIQP